MATAPVRRLDANGDRTFGRGLVNFAQQGDATKQRLQTRLKMILGEWFLDTSAGVPWYQPESSDTKPILGASGPRDLPYAEAIVKATILGTDGVFSIESFDMTFDSATRKMSIAATCRTVEGDAFNVIIGSP